MFLLQLRPKQRTAVTKTRAGGRKRQARERETFRRERERERERQGRERGTLPHVTWMDEWIRHRTFPEHS